MTDQTLTFCVASPEELRKQISAVLLKHPQKYRFVSVAIHDPQVFVYPFSINKVPLKDVHKQIAAEAVELLTLPAGEIEMDYQILSTAGDKLSGVFICMPAELLGQYYSVLEHARLFPVKLTAHILASVDSFFLEKKPADNRFCLVEFLYHHIYLTVFNRHQVEFIRVINYENPQEAKSELIQSMRSASAKSSVKKFEHFYFTGDPAKDLTLLPELERNFNITVERASFGDVNKALSAPTNFFTLNLLKDYLVSMEHRGQIYAAARAALALGLALSLVLGALLFHKSSKVRGLTSSYQSSDYQYAKDLERQLR